MTKKQKQEPDLHILWHKKIETTLDIHRAIMRNLVRRIESLENKIRPPEEET